MQTIFDSLLNHHTIYKGSFLLLTLVTSDRFLQCSSKMQTVYDILSSSHTIHQGFFVGFILLLTNSQNSARLDMEQISLSRIRTISEHKHGRLTLSRKPST